MYPPPFNYYRPESLKDALGLLTRHGDDAAILSGGQSLIPMMKLRMGDTGTVIDIGRLPDLDHIEQRGNTVHIGALATHAEIAASDIARKFPIVADCAGGIADKQVRNMGTIGGGTAIADPSGDWPCCLTVLDATIVCTGPNGTRKVGIHDFILDSYTTALALDEIVTEIQFHAPAENSGSAYVAFKRAAASYPSTTAGVLLTMNGDKCEKASIALGAAGSKPVTSRDAEALLEGQVPGRDLLEKVAAAIVEVSAPPADARGSEDFKRAMLRSVLVDAAERAIARQKGQTVKGGHRYA